MESPQVPSERRDQKRVVILHYHLFKNAGTSLDALLQSQFPGGWETQEFPSQPAANRRAVRNWIDRTPESVCFSSHTALLPPPEIAGASVIPVIFARHPLDRIASAYTFERKQGDANFGSTLARNTSLRGYIETRLAMPHDRQCRNFHTDRFKDAVPESEALDDLGRALKALVDLPFVGVVEHMDASLAQLETLLRRSGFTGLDEFKAVRKNESRGRAESLDERLSRLRADLGDEFYSEVEAVNADDLQFYEAAAARYGS